MAWRWLWERRRPGERQELARTPAMRTAGLAAGAHEVMNPINPPRPDRPRVGGLVRGENPVMLDGQLGKDIDRGPEKMNPEGSVDISNGDYRER